MADLTRLLDYSALLSIALMAATIPTYAISVSFLGRESKRTEHATDRRRRQLSEKIRGLTSQHEPLEARVRSELEATKKEMEKLKAPVYRLSVTGAVIIPVTLFGIALAFDGLALWYTGQQTTAYQDFLSGTVSIALNASGLALLCRTLLTVNSVARLPESLAEIEVTFTSGQKTQSIEASTSANLELKVENQGPEFADEVLAVLWVPKGFKVSPSDSYEIIDSMIEPDDTLVYISLGVLRPDEFKCPTLSLQMPPSRGDYEIQCNTYEKRLGRNRHFLKISVV